MFNIQDLQIIKDSQYKFSVVKLGKIGRAHV